MNRLIAFIAVVCIATTTFSAGNQWDGNDFGYNGAFGTTNGFPDDWSIATNIYTIAPDNPDNLGYLKLLNPQSTIITVTNSFVGQIFVKNIAAGVTNTIVSQDSGATISGAESGATGGSAIAGYAINISGSGSDGAVILNEGSYLSGEEKQGVVVSKLGLLKIVGAQIEGGKGTSVGADGSGSVSSGKEGVGGSSLTTLIIDSDQSDSDVIKGGDGGDDLYGVTVGKFVANGGHGISRSRRNTEMIMENGFLLGGNGGTLFENGDAEFSSIGGNGLDAGDGTLDLRQGKIIAGAGGVIGAHSAVGISEANGGSGIKISGAKLVSAEIGALDIVGGSGGGIELTGSSDQLFVSGGNGVEIDSAAGRVNFVNTHAVGGNGGTLVSDGSIGAILRGGDGLSLVGSVSSVTNTIVGGTFTGGEGGNLIDLLGTADVDGGRGALIADRTFLEIGDDTVFSGGIAGSLNGILGEQGVALEVSDANVIITNGSFFGSKGLLTSSSNNSITILGGSFGDVEFGGTNEYIDVTGGAFNEFLISGSGAKDLVLAGTASVDRVVITDGNTTVSQWKDALFNDTTVSNGVISFKGKSFSLQNGSSFALESLTAKANFNDGLIVKDGGTLNVGLGQVAVSDFTTESGAHLVTEYNVTTKGTTNGIITGQTLFFGAETEWLINAGTNTVVEDHKFILAQASTSLNSTNLTANDIIFIGDNSCWMEGIITLTNKINSLIATYGTQRDLYLALGIDPDGSSEMAKVIEDLNPLLEDEHYNLIKEAYGSQAEAQAGMGSAYVRTPEMANALIGLQSVFADQIKDRTRSYLRLDGWAGSRSHAPQGAAGPSDWYDNSVSWLDDHTPRWDMRGATRKVSDSAPMPQSGSGVEEVNKPYMASSSKTKKNYDIRLPATHQVWGRGYGSFIEQDATGGFAGYDATIAGGILGVDKRFNNLMVGLGGGYARTMLSGNAGNDGDADTLHGVAYLAGHGEKVFFDANINYAFNDVETEGADPFGYTGEYNAHSVGLYLGGGYGFNISDTVLFTPEASLLNTFYSRDEYSETSSVGFSDKDWGSYDQWSHLSSLGATLSMVKHIESFRNEMEFQPELRIHWMHEFNADLDAPTYIQSGGANIINVALQAREEDLVRVGTGVRFSEWHSDTTEFGLDLDGVIGQDYTALIVSGKIMHRF